MQKHAIDVRMGYGSKSSILVGDCTMARTFNLLLSVVCAQCTVCNQCVCAELNVYISVYTQARQTRIWSSPMHYMFFSLIRMAHGSGSCPSGISYVCVCLCVCVTHDASVQSKEKLQLGHTEFYNHIQPWVDVSTSLANNNVNAIRPSAQGKKREREIKTTCAPLLSNFNSIDYVMLNNCNRQYNVIDVLFSSSVIFLSFSVVTHSHTQKHSVLYSIHVVRAQAHWFFSCLLSRKLINYLDDHDDDDGEDEKKMQINNAKVNANNNNNSNNEKELSVRKRMKNYPVSGCSDAAVLHAWMQPASKVSRNAVLLNWNVHLAN